MTYVMFDRGKITTHETEKSLSEEMAKSKKCDRCEEWSSGVETYRQNTRYVEDERNIVTLCPICKKENDEHWEEEWAEYYSMVL